MSLEEEKRDRALEELKRVINASDEETLRFKKKHRDMLLSLLAYRIDNLVEQTGREPEAAAILIGEYIEGITTEALESVDNWIVSMLRKALVDLLKQADNPVDGIKMFKSYVEYIAERAAHIAGYDLIQEDEEDLFEI